MVSHVITVSVSADNLRRHVLAWVTLRVAPMIGKLIIFAILIVSLYAVFIRLKTRITGAPDPTPAQPQLEKSRKKGWLGDDFRISKIHMIITFLAALYLIWALITLYR
jgi:hypothetical protein